VGQAGAVIIALIIEEDLSLIFQASKGCGMQDAIAVALKCGAVFRLFFGMYSAAAVLAPARIWGKTLIFQSLELSARTKHDVLLTCLLARSLDN
jgi:hypothetical protein